MFGRFEKNRQIQKGGDPMKKVSVLLIAVLNCVLIMATICFAGMKEMNEYISLAKQRESRGQWNTAGKLWSYAARESKNLDRAASLHGESVRCFLKDNNVMLVTGVLSAIKIDASDNGKKAMAKYLPQLEELAWRLAKKGNSEDNMGDALDALKFIADEQPQKRQKLAEKAVKKGYQQLAEGLLKKD
jgi:hypothetical protein